MIGSGCGTATDQRSPSALTRALASGDSEGMRPSLLAPLIVARSRYLLTYSPDKSAPGWHKLNVKLVGAKGDVVARRGYFVDKGAGSH